MKIDALVAEIGSTTTIINAFDNLDTDNPIFIGSGFAPTSVNQGDVTIGLNQAKENLMNNLNIKEILAKETFASSSAAGGLKMSVHGLVYDMTVKAAKEAALGAGANIKLITSGILEDYQLEEIMSEELNIIMISGGVDFGERKTALENAKNIAKLKLNIPVIYAGNIQNQNLVKKYFLEENQLDYLYLSNNVYPKIDCLDVENTRIIIQNVFEKHIIKAPGMERVKEIVNEAIIPTPGAVMQASKLMYEYLGDLITVDVGGATTDIHSVTEGKDEISKILIAPEPFAKRTVEGDLGVYINKNNVVELIGKENICKKLNIKVEKLDSLLKEYKPIPNDDQISLTELLAKTAFEISLKRHAGKLVHMFNGSGKVTYAEGKDLSNVKYIIATGGALTRLPNRIDIIMDVLRKQNGLVLSPSPKSIALIDNDYIMASLGVLSIKHPKAALLLLKKSLRIE
ncbi:MAG: GlmL-related ornithine degradation protein [Candidatus Izemoplasmatales bacterium]|nr:GlmL-related ornithine degradation protein [Candidatus Izemoplasmatales bacterium]MDD4069342.1 GlmL-related ornithine degradation protein [Candidatus Izemoplasmatales bacterium]